MPFPAIMSLFVLQEAKLFRHTLHRLLTKALFGDALSADYLLFHLISKIYVRRDRLCLGKLSINMFNLPTGKPTNVKSSSFELTYWIFFFREILNKGMDWIAWKQLRRPKSWHFSEMQQFDLIMVNSRQWGSEYQPFEYLKHLNT